MASRGYRSFLSDSAAEFVVTLPRRRALVVLDRLQKLASHPTIEPDYVELDDAGRAISQICEIDFVISFWVDEAPCS